MTPPPSDREPPQHLLDHVRALRAEALRLGLEAHPGMANLTDAELARIYNGAGPDSWSALARSVVTFLLRHYRPALLVHDVDFHLSDGSAAGWLDSTGRWRRNVRRLTSDRFPLSRPWLLPLRLYAAQKAAAATAALAVGSWPAWRDAAARREGGGAP